MDYLILVLNDSLKLVYPIFEILNPSFLCPALDSESIVGFCMLDIVFYNLLLNVENSLLLLVRLSINLRYIV